MGKHVLLEYRQNSARCLIMLGRSQRIQRPIMPNGEGNSSSVLGVELSSIPGIPRGA